MRAHVPRWVRLTFVSVLALTGASLTAQSGTAPTVDPMLQSLRWRNIGNANLIGRISSVDALESDWSHVVVGSASGGVWKSVNGGTSWTTIFDNYGSASIGDVRINQQNPQIIWVGTGEECGRNSAAWGDGIYKSTDGGATFTNVGLKDSYNIAKIALHPKNQDLVYVAAIGNIYTGGGSRGVFKTIDGGKNWTKLTEGLPNDPQTGAIDLVMDPTNPEILYTAFWQRIRYPWALKSGGPHSGIFKSVNGGKTWTKLTKGLPPGDMGRSGLAIARSNPRVLMAHVEHGIQPNCGGGRGGGGGGGRGARTSRGPRSAGDAPGAKPGLRHVQARRGDVSIGGRRRELGVPRSHHQPSVLLHARRDQPARRQVHLQLQHQLPDVARRRQDVAGRRAGRRPLLPRDVARPAQQGPLLRRQRRRLEPDARRSARPICATTTSTSRSTTTWP